MFGILYSQEHHPHHAPTVKMLAGQLSKPPLSANGPAWLQQVQATTGGVANTLSSGMTSALEGANATASLMPNLLGSSRGSQKLRRDKPFMPGPEAGLSDPGGGSPDESSGRVELPATSASEASERHGAWRGRGSTWTLSGSMLNNPLKSSLKNLLGAHRAPRGVEEQQGDEHTDGQGVPRGGARHTAAVELNSRI